MKLNVSGKLYEVVAYHVRREDYLCDMDEVERLAARAQAEGDRRRLVGLSAPARLRRLPRDRRLGRREADGRHGPLRRARRRGEHPNPVEHADITTTTIHKTLCGPRSGMILCREELAKDIDRSVFPGQQGGPLMHIIAAKAVALGIAATEPFRARQRQTIANAQGVRRGADRQRGRGAHRRHRRAPGARRPRPDRPRRQDRRAAAGAGRDHRQPQRDPVRRAPADEPVRPADRHPGADHPRPRSRTTCARSRR